MVWVEPNGNGHYSPFREPTGQCNLACHDGIHADDVTIIKQGNEALKPIIKSLEVQLLQLKQAFESGRPMLLPKVRAALIEIIGSLEEGGFSCDAEMEIKLAKHLAATS